MTRRPVPVRPVLPPLETFDGSDLQSGGVYDRAELRDLDIFNDATHLNDATYEKGDLFEILVRPLEQNDYFEFHITPENQKLQLHWPDAQTIWRFDNRHESLGPYFVDEVLLRSETSVEREASQWRALVMVPGDIAGRSSTLENSVWAFSLSRYDCSRERDEPVLSSSSPHIEPKFHRQQEWGRLHFVAS